MHKLLLIGFAAVLSFTARVHALDVGPVHVHGTKVKVGNTMDVKLAIDKITRDEDDKKDQVKRIKGHRKGDTDDNFIIKVTWADLDDKSQETLKSLKEDKVYDAKLEKMDDDWKLLKIRKIDEE